MNIRLKYIIFIILIAGLNILYLIVMNDNYKIYDNNFKIIIKNLNFFYDQIIFNLLNNKGYYITKDEVIFHIRQLPINTFVIFYLIKLFNYNVFFIFLVKNITILSIYFFTIIFLQKNYKNNSNLIFFLCMFVIFIPFNLHVIFAIEFEDNLTSILVPVLFVHLICDNRNKFLIIAILCFFIYLTKQNMFMIVIILPFLIIILEKKKLRFISLVGPLLAVILWGGYSYFKTGKFAFGSSLTSYAQKELNRNVLNYKFKDYYPQFSVDDIPFEKIPSNLSNEWEVHDFYKKKNLEFIKKNPKVIFDNTIIKLNFIFFNRKIIDKISNKYLLLMKIISNYLNTIVLDIGILIFLYTIYKNFKKKDKSIKKIDIYFISIVVLILIPHLIGWATAKHLVVLTIVSAIYIACKLNLFYLKEN